VRKINLLLSSSTSSYSLFFALSHSCHVHLPMSAATWCHRRFSMPRLCQPAARASQAPSQPLSLGCASAMPHTPEPHHASKAEPHLTPMECRPQSVGRVTCHAWAERVGKEEARNSQEEAWAEVEGQWLEQGNGRERDVASQPHGYRRHRNGVGHCCRRLLVGFS